MTEDLRTRADELHTQVMDGEADLSTIVRLADDLGGAADRVAATFEKVNQALEQQAEAGPPARELTEELTAATREEQGPVAGRRPYGRADQAGIEIPGRPGRATEIPGRPGRATENPT